MTKAGHGNPVNCAPTRRQGRSNLDASTDVRRRHSRASQRRRRGAGGSATVVDPAAARRRRVHRPSARAGHPPCERPVGNIPTIGRALCTVRHSARNDPLNASMNAVSVGFPGLEKSSVTPLSQAQRSSALLMNSGP